MPNMASTVTRRTRTKQEASRGQLEHTSSLAQQHDGSYEEGSASEDKPSGTVCIENRAEQNPTEEGEKHVEAEDPSYVSIVVLAERPFTNVGHKDADAVHQTKASHQTGPSPEHDAPRSAPAFGIVVQVRAGAKSGDGVLA